MGFSQKDGHFQTIYLQTHPLAFYCDSSMRIGILTSPIANNLGGIMQNFALQQTLKDMGHTPITIDIYAPYSRLRWVAGRLKGALTKSIVNVPYPWHGRIGSRKVLQFAFKHIDRTRPYQRIDSSIIDKYNLDAVIVGSDQVWRLKYNHDISTMFLDFTESYNIKRIAYAASFGIEQWDYPEALTRRCIELIKSFDAVSVRESSDVDLCREHLNAEATHVLDPTLLLDRKVYLNLCLDIPPANKNFLFAYVLDITEKKIEAITRYAQMLNLNLVLKSAENNLNNNDTIESWISCFRDASFVITDSYHGTLFSIIFNKDFITINNPNRGQSRFKSILRLFSLNDRLKNVNNILDNHDIIDWEGINHQLVKKRQESIRFLQDNLKHETA